MNTHANLSVRETQIAELLAWGAAKKEVADRLSISVHTVDNTARNIFTKLEIQKTTELSVWWFCTRYGISFQQSPLKRSPAAITASDAYFPSRISGIRKQARCFSYTGRRTVFPPSIGEQSPAIPLIFLPSHD